MRTTLLFTALVCSLLGACAGAPPPAASSTTGGESGELPATFEPAQGATAFGVYVAHASTADAPELAQAMETLRVRGVSAGVGQLSCDTGAASVLGLSEDEYAVSADFRTREDAERFVLMWWTPVTGIAEFVAHCRD